MIHMKIKKIVMMTVLIISIISIITVFAADSGLFEKVDYSIKIGNASAEPKYPIYLKDDRIYVPLRSFCDELKIPISWNDEENAAILDINNKNISVSDKTQLKKEGVIPDEQTALAIGKIILERYAEKSLEYETDDKVYYLTAKFDERCKGWRVCQMFKYKDENRGWSAGDKFYIPTVILNKQNGEVLYINTNSSFEE